MTIQVSLDPTNVRPVTVSPSTFNINSGNQTITWSKAGNQNFMFVGVAVLSNQNLFTNLQISGQTMTIQANSNTSGADYKYVLIVQANGWYYCTVPSGGLPGNGGTPTIHNN